MFDLSVGGCESLSPPRAITPQPGCIVERVLKCQDEILGSEKLTLADSGIRFDPTTRFRGAVTMSMIAALQ